MKIKCTEHLLTGIQISFCFVYPQKNKLYTGIVFIKLTVNDSISVCFFVLDSVIVN